MLFDLKPETGNLKPFWLLFSPNKLKILKVSNGALFLKLCLKHCVYKLAHKLLQLNRTNL